MKEIVEVRCDSLNASIITKEYIEVDEVKYYKEGQEYSQYHNSKSDVDRLKKEQPEEIVNGILSVWGDTPTVIDP